MQVIATGTKNKMSYYFELFVMSGAQFYYI